MLCERKKISLRLCASCSSEKPGLASRPRLIQYSGVKSCARVARLWYFTLSEVAADDLRATPEKSRRYAWLKDPSCWSSSTPRVSAKIAHHRWPISSGLHCCAFRSKFIAHSLQQICLQCPARLHSVFVQSPRTSERHRRCRDRHATSRCAADRRALESRSPRCNSRFGDWKKHREGSSSHTCPLSHTVSYSMPLLSFELRLPVFLALSTLTFR